MDILLLLLPVSLFLLIVGGVLFWWTVRSGQYDDLDSPAQRILFDDDDEMIPEDAKKHSDSKKSNERERNTDAH